MNLDGIHHGTLLRMYADMVRMRAFEERVALLLEGKEILCPTHLYIGEEAVAAGVCASLNNEDAVFGYHRSHGHFIAKGCPMAPLMAELFCRSTGLSGGRGGSMHICDPAHGLLGITASVGGSIPNAVGAALGFRHLGREAIAVAFFGDGATCEGVFYESLNFASLYRLPVVFICENNLYSTHMPVMRSLANPEIYRQATSFGFPGIRIDGNDAAEVFRTAEAAIQKAREGKGPTLIECMTYRWRGHVGPAYDLDKGLRSQEELDSWRGRCPIAGFEHALIANGILSLAQRVHIRKAADREVEDAVRFAKASPCPDSTEGELWRNLFAGW